MGNVAIVTDSNSGISQAEGKELGIYVIPMPFLVDGKLYFEDVDMNKEQFYHFLENDADLSTSQPSPGDVMDLWDKLLKEYDEIINELLSEREEAVRIAQAYKSELEKVVISDEDIEHLHNTVSRILEVIKNLQDDNSEDNNQVNEQIQTYEQIKELISIDTLKTMQLLGFNYKSAIGEPLTLMLRNFILSKIDDNEAIKKVVTSEMVEILKDETAYKNFKQFTGIEQN